MRSEKKELLISHFSLLTCDIRRLIVEEQVININDADELTLATLPGISLRLAERIIAYREEHGAFATVGELTAVSGISPRMVEQMAERITTNNTAVTIEPPLVPVQDTAEPATTPEPFQETITEPPSPAEPLTPMIEPPKPDLENTPTVITTTPLTSSPPHPITSSPHHPTSSPSLISHLIAALFGAILGTTLTLAILFGFNQTLQYGSQAQADEVQYQLETELQTVQQTQEELQNELDSLNRQVETVTTVQADTAVIASTAQADIEELQTAATSLQARAEELNQHLEAVAASAQDFDAFLTGLRDLLLNVAGPLPTFTPIPEQTPTTAVTATPTTAATLETAATRTPRPTATRIGLSTPAP
jgi:competence ComEA-like helix-hairpin-helix protein